jgi:hypothetical protein
VVTADEAPAFFPTVFGLAAGRRPHRLRDIEQSGDAAAARRLAALSGT